ncbi:FAD:protein FMN transferase [Thalassovita mediterranea]|uniref:FAD:protein FMN transferase n=1 Tax=Thalassovita mediterranea TaxID=340021 RepID=A0A0P1GP56_9RHOB|nr:FAD:protein FMN transferase [Thalassovita mediterranea]CUH84087.1 Thiamine biosynthesis lipoprotein ApbE precursor [Thalassovita mediterranea]SIS27752.1 thiamine biosynthesis lipoprotein [Thalassovita mediterranea]
MTQSIKFSRRTVLWLPVALAACQSRSNVIEMSGVTMGTTYKITAVDHKNAVTQAQAQDAVNMAFARVNTLMSNWDSNSEVSRLNAANAGQTMTVSPELAEVLQAANDINAASDGQFDVTLGPLIDLWGFGAKGTTSAAPSDAEIARVAAVTGQQDVLEIRGNQVRKHKNDATIYLSAIGKGFGVDAAGKALAELGLQDYMVEVGGDIVTAGKNPDGLDWRIGVETPLTASPALQQVAKLSNMGLATSGDYRNYFEQDGQRFSHILDAKTGRPVTHRTASATVLADNAMLADAWATAMLVLGKERGMEIAKEQNLAVLFIERGDSDFVTTASPRFQALQA